MKTSARSRQTDLPQMELPLTQYAEGSRVSRSVAHPEGAGLPQTYGLKCSESSAASGPKSSLVRTSKSFPLDAQPTNLARLDTEQLLNGLAPKTLALTIREAVGGFVHTPTTKANFTAPSMQKWPVCRRYVKAFGDGPIMPEQFEFLMGFPIGWTEIEL